VWGNPDIDKVTTYDVGALIAGKVAAKLGLLVTILIFLKNFWILAILGVGGFFKKYLGKMMKECTHFSQKLIYLLDAQANLCYKLIKTISL